MAIIKTTNRSITGTILPANLGSGTASSSTVLYGDSTFKTEPAFDDNKLVNDISTLALHQATNNNSAKYNLTNSNVDVYQDSSAIANLVNVARDTTGEYISSIYTDTVAFTSDSDTALLLHMEDNSDSSSGTQTIALNGNASFSTAQAKFGSKSLFCSSSGNGFGTIPANNRFQVGAGALTVECWAYGTAKSGGHQSLVGKWYSGNIFDMRFEASDASGNFGLHDQATMRNSGQSSGLNAWHHFAWTRDGSSNNTLWYDGVSKVTWQNGNSMSFGTNSFYFGQLDGSVEFNGYIDEVRISTVSRYSSAFTPNSASVANATGNYESTAQTANASVNKISAVVTYTNASGTNSLNTDIILQVSADNGSNWSNATLTAAGTFSTGVLQAVTNDISVTAGTQLKYKIFFANQASGSKVARINGVSLSY